MQTELLRGVPMSDAVGGGDPKLVAQQLALFWKQLSGGNKA
jgi:hypothetical protein